MHQLMSHATGLSKKVAGPSAPTQALGHAGMPTTRIGLKVLQEHLLLAKPLHTPAVFGSVLDWHWAAIRRLRLHVRYVGKSQVSSSQDRGWQPSCFQ